VHPFTAFRKSLVYKVKPPGSHAPRVLVIEGVPNTQSWSELRGSKLAGSRHPKMWEKPGKTGIYRK